VPGHPHVTPAAIRRVAAAAVEQGAADEDAKALKKKLEKAKLVFPRALLFKLRHAFTPKGEHFFRFYILLREIRLGAPVPEDIKQQFRRVSNWIMRIKSPVDHRHLSPPAANQIAEARHPLNTQFNRLLQGNTEDPFVWKRVNDVMVPMIVEVAKDKGIYLKARQPGRERWAVFRKMTPKQQQIERLRDDDPESYALMVRQGKTLGQIDTGIEARIEAAGLQHRKAKVMGRPVHIGTDPTTGEERIYDRDGDILTFEDYLAKRKEQEEYRKKLDKVPSRTRVPLQQLRTLDDDAVDILEGEVEWMALTDDIAKQGRLTRIFATKRTSLFIGQPDGTMRVRKVPVISSGRYKGVFLDDMVNSQGRLIEGTAYTLVPVTGRSGKVPKRMDPGQREPYVTLADTVAVTEQGSVKEKKLFLKVPGTKQFTELRNAMKKLACNFGSKSGCLPSVSFHSVKGSREACFYFDPKDFSIIRDILQGMSLSKGALEHLKTYFKDLARAEAATAEENLGHYSAKALGGFKTVLKNRDTGKIRKVDLLGAQKQALAWLDAKGNQGICALDTGIGKSLVAIGMMQKLIRDGLADDDATYPTPTGKTVQTNGRFLLVSPPDLKGNLTKEIRKFISNPRDLLRRLDVVSYTEFQAAQSGRVPGILKNKPFWKERRLKEKARLERLEQQQGRQADVASRRVWDIALYTAIFFDEAHKLTLTKHGNVTSLTKPTKAFEAANAIYHPRKIMLTASPMEKDPQQAYLISAISSNTLLAGPSEKARESRHLMRRFMDRFTERVGGRIVGVRQDPMLKRDLDTWVKQNVFFEDKMKVDEYDLQDARQETVAVQMPPAVEEVYRKASKGFARTMRALVVKFRDKGHGNADARDPELERFFGQTFKPLVDLFNALSNYPEEGLEDVAHMLETGTMPRQVTKEGEPYPLPPVLLRALRGLKRDPAELRDVARTVGSPKIERAAEVVWDKMLRTAGTARTLLFTDDKRFCMKAVAHLAENIPGRHAVALNDQILIYEGAVTLDDISREMDLDEVVRILKGDEEAALEAYYAADGMSRFQLPLVLKAYRRYPMLPANDRYNIQYRRERWQEFALKEVIVPDTEIRTCTLLGTHYQFGHNLQAFDTVIHLDRNTWNSESMKQRGARAWRQGQEEQVDIITLDATYADGPDFNDADHTLDEVRRIFQEMEGALFDQIIKAAQGVQLGEAWQEIVQRDASLMKLDRRVLELIASPYASRSKTPGDDWS